MDDLKAAQVRQQLLSLLSDEENARVSTAEGGEHLAEGQEYVDLDDLDEGVQRVGSGSKVIMDGVLPRHSVSEASWNKIVKHLTARA